MLQSLSMYVPNDEAMLDQAEINMAIVGGAGGSGAARITHTSEGVTAAVNPIFGRLELHL